MRRDGGIWCAVAAACLLAVSCDFSDFGMPEEVAVKTDADFKIPLGKVNLAKLANLGETLNSDTLLKTVQDSVGESGVAVYDYVLKDDPSTLAYLIHYPVYTVPVDVGSVFENLDLDSLLNRLGGNGLAFSQSITLPQMALPNTPITVTIPDFGGKISASISNNTLEKDLSPVPEVSTNGLPVAKTTITVNGTVDGITYKYLHYKTGSNLSLKVERTDGNAVSDEFRLNLTAIISDGTTRYSSATTEVSRGGTLSLPVEKLPPKFGITITAAAEGGVITNIHSYKITADFSSASIAYVEGVSAASSALGVNDDDLKVDQEVSLDDLTGYFESATIGKGELTIQAERPSAWDSGVKVDIQPLTISGAGLYATATNGTDSALLLDKKIDLANQTLKPTPSNNSIKVAGTMQFYLENANIYFNDDGSSEQVISVNLGGGIETLKEAVVDFSSEKYADVKTDLFSLPTTGDGAVPLPSELTTYVQKLNFAGDGSEHYQHTSSGEVGTTKLNGLGLTGKFVNSLPEGCDISLTVTSKVFDLNLSPVLTGSGSEEAQIMGSGWVAFPDIDLAQYKDKDTNIDLSVTMPEKVTLKNLTIGETYTLGISDVSMVYDWDSVSLDLSSQSFKDEQSVPLDLSSMLSDLPSSIKDNIAHIEMTELPVYFYATRPTSGDLGDLFSSVGLKGAVTLKYNNTEESLVKNTETIKMVDDVPWPTNTAEQIQPSNPLNAYFEEGKYSFTTDLAKIFNTLAQADSSSDDSELKISYDIGITGGSSDALIVYSAMIPSVEDLQTAETINIGIDLAAILPFKLNLVAPIAVDIMQLIDSSNSDEKKDLLQRDEAYAYEKYEKYCKYIESIGLKWDADFKLLEGLDIATTITYGKDGNKKTLDLEPLKGGTFTGSKIQEILDPALYPFSPEVTFSLGRALNDKEKTGGKYLNANGDAEGVPLSISREGFKDIDNSLSLRNIRVVLDIDGKEEINVTEIIDDFGGSK